MENPEDREQERSAARPPEDSPNERFTLSPGRSGERQTFTDPREAGAAFFAADPSERPVVIHAGERWARTMANTQIHGEHETGEPRYFKSLPDSHAPDAEFRAGFLEAMEASVSERLGKVDWDAPAENRLDARLQDDLEAFARREPEKAASLWNAHTGDAPPGRELRAAVDALEGAAEREVREAHTTGEADPKVVASGDWVTTDADVELRPVAVETERGIHTGYAASFAGGETALTFSEQTFPNSRDAFRHAWDFYEGGEEGLGIAVRQRAELDRMDIDPDQRAPGLMIETRSPRDEPRREAAIFAGEDPQLIVSFGRDNADTRELAGRLTADAGFRKIVEAHVSDAADAIGSGTFTDGEGSGGFLPDKVLTVTFPDREGQREVVAQLPDQSPLSAEIAVHLADSPILAEHAAQQRDQAAFHKSPSWALSDWMAESEEAISFLPKDAQPDLRREMYGIAGEAAAAFGLDREQEQIQASPRSTLYSTAISATGLAVGSERTDLFSDAGEVLKAGLQAAALEAGIDGAKIERRLETGAANAHQEESWVRSDIAEVAARHRLDLGEDQARNRAADLVDRFYEKAAELVHAARTAEVVRDSDHLVDTLGTMSQVHASQGAVAFRNEDQARDFADEMKTRYGATVLKDLAEGRTEALAKDVPDPGERLAMAQAVVAAAREHPALGLDAHETDVAERKLAQQARDHDRADRPGHERNRDLAREF